MGGSSVAQVCIYWNLVRNSSVVIKSKSFARLRENLNATDIQVCGSDLAQIDDIGPRMAVYGPCYWGFNDADLLNPWVNRGFSSDEDATNERSRAFQHASYMNFHETLRRVPRPPP